MVENYWLAVRVKKDCDSMLHLIVDEVRRRLLNCNVHKFLEHLKVLVVFRSNQHLDVEVARFDS
jgi:hypothetical protein